MRNRVAASLALFGLGRTFWTNRVALAGPIAQPFHFGHRLSRQSKKMPRTVENYLRWKFGQWAADGHVPNVILLDANSPNEIKMEPGETPIARIGLDSALTSLLLTNQRLVHEGETFVRFADVQTCIWIDRDPKQRGRLKTTKFDRLYLDLKGGREILIEGLGQAVFPLLKLFWDKLGR